LFGLTNSEGNHGEDVKEYYFYIDSTPTHSYMKYLYKYPQGEFPYRELVVTNRNRSREDFEYELIDTGIFDGDRYFDMFVEYAKEGPEDVLIRITVHNRGPQTSRLRLLPTMWFRNTWSSGEEDQKPSLREVAPGVIQASHHQLGKYWLYCDEGPELLFTENESNTQRLSGQPSASLYVKDAFHEHVISGRADAVNSAKIGTKAAAHYILEVPRGGSKTVRLRLSAATLTNAFAGFEKTFKDRIADADEFYDRITPHTLTEDECRVHRQALAGMLWNKQFYYFDLDQWLKEHKSHPPAPIRPSRLTEHGLVSHAERRRDLHARQMGVSLVRGLRSRLPCDLVGSGGFRFRQRATAANVAPSLHRSQRSNSRLRMELQ
jgi:hypothetical protein